MKKNTFIAFAFLAMLFSSCAAPNISYFNDMNHGQIEDAVKELDILLLPDDKISIVVQQSILPVLTDDLETGPVHQSPPLMNVIG